MDRSFVFISRIWKARIGDLLSSKICVTVHDVPVDFRYMILLTSCQIVLFVVDGSSDLLFGAFKNVLFLYNI